VLTDLFLGPDEGLGFVVVGVDLGIDVFLKLLEACEGGAAKRLPLQDRKPFYRVICDSGAFLKRKFCDDPGNRMRPALRARMATVEPIGTSDVFCQ
jgi:hypothetical protein